MISRDRNHYNFQTEVRVRLSETDAVGIVFFGSFSSYLDVGRMDYLNHLGLAPDTGEVAGLPPGAVVKCAIDFCAPARYNDVLLVHVRVARLGSTSYTFHFLIEQKRDRNVVATGALTLVWLGSDFRPVAVPESFRQPIRQLEGPHLDEVREA